MKAIISLVRKGESVADIGCDHGYIPIVLYKTGISPKCIASDVKEGPVRIAKENILQFRASEGVETRIGDGLTVLRPGEADTAVITGMGGRTILGILSQKWDVASGMNMILSPQSEVDEVRRFLAEKGFRIEEECFVKEDNKYYPVIRALYTGEFYLLNEEEALFGPMLLADRSGALKEFILIRKDWLLKIIETLSRETSASAEGRKKELESELSTVNRALEYYV